MTIQYSKSSLSRRKFLLSASAAAMLPAFSNIAQAKTQNELILYGPPAGPSIILANLAGSDLAKQITPQPSFKIWQNPDELRSGLTTGAMQAVVLPIQVAANLYNRGMPLKLLNVMTNGLIFILSSQPDIKQIQDLKGKTIAVPFRNDMPDLVFNRILEHYEMTGSVTIRNTGTPTEAIQMLLAGLVDTVLAPEPACSAAILKGKKAGKDIYRAIDVQKVWGDVSGGEPVLPQAGLALTNKLMAENSDLAAKLNDLLGQAAQQVNQNPQQAAQLAAASLNFPAPVIAASIKYSNLVATPANQARSSIESMLNVLAATDPAIIGGHLPDSDFYI